MMKSGKKVLITSAIPLNNGDAALVFSLADNLIKRGYQVTISTYYYKKVKQIYKNYHFVREILDYKFFKKVPILKKTYIKLFTKFNKSIRDFDYFIAAPGGYINNYYGFAHTLEFLKQMHLKGKITGIYAQSVGPLSAKNKEIFMYYQQFIGMLYVRDLASLNEVIGISAHNNFKLVEDGAFLLEPVLNINQKTNKVAISVRAWRFDQRNENIYIELIKQFIQYLIGLKYNIVFLSTCQGIENYTDDSKMAKSILQKLPENLQAYCSIDTNFYTLKDFRKRLSDFEMVIGTRLHMCLLALLSEIPAFNISYERKGKEAYNYLKMNNYSCDYNEESSVAMEKFKTFVSEQLNIRKELSHTVYEKHISAQNNLDFFMNSLNEKSIDRPNKLI